MSQNKSKLLGKIIFNPAFVIGIITFIVVVTFGVYYGLKFNKNTYEDKLSGNGGIANENIYVRFLMESYDIILKNYWKEPVMYDLPKIYQLSLEKVTNQPQNLEIDSDLGTSKMLSKVFDQSTTTEAKKQLALNTLIVVLYNLEPIGRNSLHSAQQEKDFRKFVSNIDTSHNLYNDLGLSTTTNISEVTKAYKKIETALKDATSTEQKQILAKATYAKQVLTDQNNKVYYDQKKIEPTIFDRIIDKTLYLYIDRVSPTTIEEFKNAIVKAKKNTNANTLIIDLRDNIGGSFDFLQNLLGLFLGKDQLAFSALAQGIKIGQTTSNKLSELDNFKEIAILTNGKTQSTAELATATFLRYKLAHIVGTRTAGWGTIENSYQLKNTLDENEIYYLFLVNGLTLRSDDQPIEGRGVDVDVDITKLNWKDEINDYFNSPSIIKALQNIADKLPIK